MGRRRRRIAIVAVATVCTVLAAAWIFLSPIVRTIAWPSILQSAARKTGLRVAGDLRELTLTPGRASISAAVLGAPSDAISARARAIDARFDARSIASRSPHIEAIVVSGLDLDVDLDRAKEIGDVLARLRGSGTGESGARIDHVEISKCVVRAKWRGKEIRLSDVNGEARLDALGLTGASLSGTIGTCQLDVTIDPQRRIRLRAHAATPPLELLDWLGVPEGKVGGASMVEADVELHGVSASGHVRAHADSVILVERTGGAPLDLVADVGLAGDGLTVAIESATSRGVELRNVALFGNVTERRGALSRPTTIELDLAALGSPVPGRAVVRLDRLEASAAGDVVATARLEISGLSTPSGPVRITEGTVALAVDVDRRRDGTWLAHATGDVGEVEMDDALGSATFRPAISATARVAEPSGSLHDVDIEATLTAESVGQFNAMLQIRDGVVRSGRLGGGEVPLATFAKSAKGTIACRLEYERRDESQAHVVTGEIVARGAGVAVPGVEADGVNSTLAIGATFDERHRLDLTVRGPTTGFVGIAQKYSVDLTATPLTLGLAATYDSEADRVELHPSHVAIGTLIDVDISGSVTGLKTTRDATLAATAAVPDLDAVFRAFVAPNIQDSEPAVAALTVSGRLEARADARILADAPVEIAGRFGLRDVGVNGSTIEVTHLDADLPLGFGTRAPVDEATIAARMVRVGGVRGDRVRLAFRRRERGWMNDASLEPLPFSAYGGTISLSGLGLRTLDGSADDFLGGATLVATASIDGLQATQMFPNFVAKYPFDATMRSSSNLDVAVSLSELHVKGDADIHAFGGFVRIRGFDGERPFSPLARFKTSMTAEDIDLARLSHIFDYGDVSGVVAIEMPYLWIGAGEVERFLVRFRSVDGRSRQLVGLKALQQIPYLSNEGRLTLQGHIARFLGAFRYSKLGAVLALRNGIFQFHGRFDEDGNDLFGTPDRFVWPLRRLEGVQEYLLLPAGLIPRLAIDVNPALFGVSFDEFIAEIRSAHGNRSD